MPFARLNCHESENLYLTDEMLLELGYSWEDAKVKIVSEANNFGNKSNILKDIAEINRQTSDVKNIINEIAEILDPKNLLWTVRLGKLIGKEKPEGMLGEFIGEDVVNTLWKNVT